MNDADQRARAPMTPGPSDVALAQRIDKWLWHARFARTRVAAQRLTLSGHVRVNREKIGVASRLVRAGDVITIALERHVKVVRVKGIAERRGSPADAALLYEDQAIAAATPAPASLRDAACLAGE